MMSTWAIPSIVLLSEKFSYVFLNRNTSSKSVIFIDFVIVLGSLFLTLYFCTRNWYALLLEGYTIKI